MLPSLGPLLVSLMPHEPTGRMTWPGGSSALSLAGAVPSGKGPSRCQGGLVRMVLLPPLPRRYLVWSSGTSLPSKLQKSVLSKPLPTDTVAPGPLSHSVPCGVPIMWVIWSHSAGCFAQSKRGKSCGIDGVRGDFCAIAPAGMANVYHPLLTKCALRVQEPLAHKCGVAVDLWKGKGDHSSMKWYRSLLLNSVVQKHHYRFMRGRLMVLLGAVFLDPQCGGFRGTGATLASLSVRGLPPLAPAVLAPWPCLWNLTSGSTVVRELVVRLQTSGDDLERVLESIGAPVQLESALPRLMAEPSIVERHLGEGHLSALLSEAHANTWFVVEGQLDVARAVRGSRPGCCLADFVFNVAFAPALVDVRCALGDAVYLRMGASCRPEHILPFAMLHVPIDHYDPDSWIAWTHDCARAST